MMASALHRLTPAHDHVPSWVYMPDVEPPDPEPTVLRSRVVALVSSRFLRARCAALSALLPGVPW